MVLAMAAINGVMGKRDLPRANAILLDLASSKDRHTATRALFYLAVSAKKAKG